ncbi:MAG: biotin-independent malonate decarboxylase subunit beta [Lentisphaerae bacterium]|nr:biotin-independent malonate decarboxylase subunit beta [Lentisphaerota bacterium]
MRLKTVKNYFESTARQRITGILDAGSFREFCPPPERIISPHLKHFNIPAAFDDGVIVGEGRLDGRSVAVAVQEGRFMGGAIGEVHSAKIIGILRRCLKTEPEAMLFLFDSGGVRLQEANAGEIGVAEIIRALLDVRAAGVPVVGTVGGSCGCFGGAGIINGCCDFIIVSEEGRIGVSGPEVIETNMGVEVFDSRDRALVWRTFGGKNRYLQGAVRDIVENSIGDFRVALIKTIALKSEYSLKEMAGEHKMLEDRAERFAGCYDGREIWRKMGFKEPEKIPDISIAELKSMRKKLGGAK